jgi:hypothetical protein
MAAMKILTAAMSSLRTSKTQAPAQVTPHHALGPSRVEHGHAAHIHTDQCADHGHHHAAASTPGHYLAMNPCDAPDFSEVCACCQGAIDVDELVGLKIAAPHEVAETHGSHSLRPHLPHTRAAWVLAGATAWATLPGLYFGVQNVRAAKTNERLLVQTKAALMEQTSVANEPVDVRLNRAAYIKTLESSISMQRFIGLFAGALPLIGSSFMLASVVVPALATVGSAFLMLYCVSHIVRYLTYERVGVKKTQALLVAAPKPQDTMARAGLAASEKLLARRAQLYPTVAASFAVYAVGAGLLTASALLTAPSLIMPGVSTLVCGLAAVVFLNNGPIKATFGKNQDRNVDRKSLGDQHTLLRRIGELTQQHAAVVGLNQSLSAAEQKSLGLNYYGLLCLEGAALVASYGLTFGIYDFGSTHVRTARRAMGIQALQNPQNILRAYATSPGATDADLPSTDAADARRALTALRYHRADTLAHQQSALLDHFHARVYQEGYTAPQHMAS